MLKISAKIRKETGKKVKIIRKNEKVPAVIYGPTIKPVNLELDLKLFEKAYKEAGESSFLSLKIEGDKEEHQVLIHDTQTNPLTDKFIHIDFYQPSLKEKIQIKVPLIFEGQSEAVKSLGGTLVKSITELEVKALPQNLPHEFRVNIDKLKTFEDRIKISDLNIPKDVEILKQPEEIIVSVFPPEKVEEELKKPIEEKVEEVEKVEKKKKEEEPAVEENIEKPKEK